MAAFLSRSYIYVRVCMCVYIHTHENTRSSRGMFSLSPRLILKDPSSWLTLGSSFLPFLSLPPVFSHPFSYFQTLQPSPFDPRPSFPDLCFLRRQFSTCTTTFYADISLTSTRQGLPSRLQSKFERWPSFSREDHQWCSSSYHLFPFSRV